MTPTTVRCVHPFLQRRLELLLLVFAALLPPPIHAQDRLTAETFTGLELRNIGPALMSGRIADLAIHPRDRHTWYVAVGSGGVWKTINAGTTWTPIFDDQGSYSIGCVAIDPRRPDVIWVGTGENVSGRHVGYGDGVYKSQDGGQTWTHVGLRTSEHIARILIDPRDSDVVWVAAEGPLWSAGGERGVYKTQDGGTTWRQVLAVGENTGATSLELDPRNPDVLYAAAYQRRRQVWSHLAGGKESGIYKSSDGGETWRRVTRGLPEGPMGKIGLSVSPVDPDVVYATIEALEKERGFYRSLDAGESWEKRSEYLSDGTGPHYYQEIYASPHKLDRVYQMDVFMNISEDGGETFHQLGEPDKHSDNHALAFDPQDPDYLLAGCDGGVYETFDHGKSWRFIANLPLTQIYKLALDDALPFYHVVGGTQDNGTQTGPVGTTNVHGIRNQDWIVPYGADGYATAVEPGNPDILYVSWQGGHPLRYDRRTGEALDVQPQPAPADPPERYNWDAPILVSPHSPTRLYYGSYRVWRSEDRGDSWTPISGDLTRGQNRYEMPVLGRVQSVDALYGNTAMSWYGTLTAIDESPLAPGLLYAGSDDGAISVSEDGGATWRRSGSLPGIPELAFVNELRASRHDQGTVYAALDDHKQGNYTPYLLKSTDRGRTWQSIRGDLPDRHLVWSLVEDHGRAELLFAGTELGIYFTLDGGSHWIELQGGVPTIAFRDLEIQRRENDLVGASFGRGFFVLDDYSPLRQVTAAALEAEALLFPVKRAWWYVPAQPLGSSGKASSGSDLYVAPNPPFGAVFTLYLRDELKTAKEQRREQEQALEEAGKDVPFPGWDELRQEELAAAPQIVLTVRDGEGQVVRRLDAPGEAGFHRVAWDLRYPPPDPIVLAPPADQPPWFEPPRGFLAPPGGYSVELARLDGEELVSLAEAQAFEVVALENATLAGQDPADVATFSRRTSDLQRRALGAAAEVTSSEQRLDHLEKALLETPGAGPALFASLRRLEAELADVRLALAGDALRQRLEEPTTPAIVDRLSTITGGHWGTRHGPTATHRRSLEIAAEQYAAVSARLRRLIDEDLRALEEALEAAGAPWTPGRRIPE